MNQTYDISNGWNAGPWLAGPPQRIINYAKCPRCGGLMVDDGMIYTSNPPQYKFECKACGHIAWSGELLKEDL